MADIDWADVRDQLLDAVNSVLRAARAAGTANAEDVRWHYSLALTHLDRAAATADLPLPAADGARTPPPGWIARAVRELKTAVAGRAQLAEEEEDVSEGGWQLRPQITYIDLDLDSDEERDAGRLAGLRAIAETFGGRPRDVSPGDTSSSATVEVPVVVGGVELLPWTTVVAPGVVADARAWIAEGTR